MIPAELWRRLINIAVEQSIQITFSDHSHDLYFPSKVEWIDIFTQKEPRNGLHGSFKNDMRT